MYKIGDIVRNKFSNNITGLVFGFGIGNSFDKRFHFNPNETIWLSVNEDGIIYPISNSNPDYEIVDHVDFNIIREKIKKARDVV